MRKLGLSLSLTSAAMAVRSAFKIASVNPVLWWDAESHRAGLAGGAATLFQGAAGTSAVTNVEQPVGMVRSMANAGPRRNLLTYSDQFENAAWTKQSGVTVTANQATAPDGSATADLLTPSTASGYLWGVASSSTGTNTLSIYAKAGASRYLGVDIWVSMTDTGGIFDLLTGTYVGAGGMRAIQSQRITAVGDGWYRIELTDSRFGSSISRVGFAASTATGALTSTVGNSVFIWGAQLETGSVASDYQKITSGVEYLDALQATSTARPVLTARKNLLTFSEQFDNASWAASGCVAVGSILTETAGAGQHRIQKSIASTSGAVYSISCEVERVGGSRHFMLDLSSGTNGYCYFDLSNGTHLLLGSGMSDVSVVGVGAGKYKISANFTTTAAALSIYVAMCSAKAGGAETYVADGSGVLSVKNLQVELGTTATSYQRVTTATDYDIKAAPLMLRFDGVDDALSTGTFAAGTLPADADVYMVVNRALGDGRSVLLTSAASNSIYMGCVDDDGFSPESPSYGGITGGITQSVNGVDVPGGVNTTRGQLATALPPGKIAVLELKNANLSNLTDVLVAGYGFGYNLTGSIGAVLITPAQPDATRAKIRKALAKAYQITGVV